jgi:hypothetical protein
MKYSLVAGDRSTGGDASLGHNIALLASQAYGVPAGANSPVHLARGSMT